MSKSQSTHGGKRKGAGRKPAPKNTGPARFYCGRMALTDIERIKTYLTPDEMGAALLQAYYDKLGKKADQVLADVFKDQESE